MDIRYLQICNSGKGHQTEDEETSPAAHNVKINLDPMFRRFRSENINIQEHIPDPPSACLSNKSWYEGREKTSKS